MSQVKMSANWFIRFILILLIFTDCNRISTKPKLVDFRVNINLVEDSLIELVKCDHIDLNGMETLVNNKIRTKIQIRVSNVYNLSVNSNLELLGKSLASRIKKLLLYPEDFDDYEVMFIKIKSTKDNYTYESFSYLSNDL